MSRSLSSGADLESNASSGRDDVGRTVVIPMSLSSVQSWRLVQINVGSGDRVIPIELMIELPPSLRALRRLSVDRSTVETNRYVISFPSGIACRPRPRRPVVPTHSNCPFVLRPLLKKPLLPARVLLGGHAGPVLPRGANTFGSMQLARALAAADTQKGGHMHRRLSVGSFNILDTGERSTVLFPPSTTYGVPMQVRRAMRRTAAVIPKRYSKVVSDRRDVTARDAESRLQQRVATGRVSPRRTIRTSRSSQAVKIVVKLEM